MTGKFDNVMVVVVQQANLNNRETVDLEISQIAYLVQERGGNDKRSYQTVLS